MTWGRPPNPPVIRTLLRGAMFVCNASVAVISTWTACGYFELGIFAVKTSRIPDLSLQTQVGNVHSQTDGELKI